MICLQTGLLHDVVEDTSATIEEVASRFGQDVSRCVDGVTKLTKLDLHSKEDRQAESLRKMLLAMVSDIRVIIVKLADRLHNMVTSISLGVMATRSAGFGSSVLERQKTAPTTKSAPAQTPPAPTQQQAPKK